jgi:hypothetical protein
MGAARGSASSSSHGSGCAAGFVAAGDTLRERGGGADELDAVRRVERLYSALRGATCSGGRCSSALSSALRPPAADEPPLLRLRLRLLLALLLPTSPVGSKWKNMHVPDALRVFRGALIVPPGWLSDCVRCLLSQTATHRVVATGRAQRRAQARNAV